MIKKYKNLLLLIVLIVIVYTVFKNKEMFGSGAYHHSNFLSTRIWDRELKEKRGKNLVKGINQMKENEKEVEKFTQVDRKDHSKNNDFKQIVPADLKDNKYNEYNPNRYVLSDYSNFEIAEKGVLQFDMHELEHNKYELPETYQKFDAKEVKPKLLDSGSGLVSNMANAFQKKQRDQYYHDIAQLNKRGNNASKASTELIKHMDFNAKF